MLKFANYLGVVSLILLVTQDASAVTVRAAVGADAAAIQATVDQFRADLGVNNGVGPCMGACVPGIGRREINWDGVPDSFSSGGTDPFPGNFFNLATGNPAGRIRGAQFATMGAFEVSADSDSNNDGIPGPVPTLFGNHTADNPFDFAAFSAERIFGLVGTNQMDVTFDIPGQPGTAGLVRGFGVVFTDVELIRSTVLDFFDTNGVLLHTESALPFSAGEGGDTGKSFSFLGVSFDDAVVGRVHITSGGLDLNLAQFGADDNVAMDDFIYGEPLLVPEPTLTGFAIVGLAALSLMRRRRIG